MGLISGRLTHFVVFGAGGFCAQRYHNGVLVAAMMRGTTEQKREAKATLKSECNDATGKLAKDLKDATKKIRGRSGVWVRANDSETPPPSAQLPASVRGAVGK